MADKEISTTEEAQNDGNIEGGGYRVTKTSINLNKNTDARLANPPYLFLWRAY